MAEMAEPCGWVRGGRLLVCLLAWITPGADSGEPSLVGEKDWGGCGKPYRDTGLGRGSPPHFYFASFPPALRIGHIAKIP